MIPGGIFFLLIYPGGKTPCECFQAEKVVVVVVGKPFFGGEPRLIRQHPRRGGN